MSTNIVPTSAESEGVTEKQKIQTRGKGKKPFKLSEDPEYTKNYYHRVRAVKYHCPNCAKLVARDKMWRHVKTAFCARHSKDPEEVAKIKEQYAKDREGH